LEENNASDPNNSPPLNELYSETFSLQASLFVDETYIYVIVDVLPPATRHGGTRGGDLFRGVSAYA